MVYAPIANLRGPAGYMATGAAEDDLAISMFLGADAGMTETRKVADANYLGKNELFTPVSRFKTSANTLTQAVQAAIDFAHGRVMNGQTYGGCVWLGEGSFQLGKIYLRSGVYLVGGRGDTQGYREGPTRVFPSGLAPGEFIFNQVDPAVNLRQCGIRGISAYGGGPTTTTGLMNFPNASDLHIKGVHADNWGAEAAIIGGGNNRVENSFLMGLANRAAVTTRRGAFTLTGADHQVSNCEFTGPGRDTVSSAALNCHGALINVSESLFSNCIFQIGDVGMGQTGGSRNRWIGCRFDTNAGHGTALYAGTYGTWVGCSWSRNSYAGNGLYDHINVPADGAAVQSFDQPMFNNNGRTARYNISDGKNSATFKNRYVHAFGETGASGFYNITGTSDVVIPDNVPQPISGATPSVLNQRNVWTNNATPTAITDFLHGVQGQRLTILSADGGNTTIKHDNVKIGTKSGADIVLTGLGSVEFIRRGNQWREI